MASRLRLRVTPTTGDAVSFDFDGTWSWEETERTFRASGSAAAPDELESIRHVWQVAGLLVLRNGSEVDGWTAFQAALATFRSRSNPVTHAKLVLVDGSSEVEVLTLGPSDHEGFRVDAIRGETYELDPGATNHTVWPFALRFSAQQVFEKTFDLPAAVQVTGVVGFEQTIRTDELPSGLSTLVAETIVTTKKGVDARVKARLLGLIPRPATTWAYDTNGDTGVRLENLDADEVSASTRVPTKVRAICALRQYGLTVGSGGPGDAPGRIEKTVTSTDDDNEIVTITTAEAEGPNRETWVSQHAPARPHETKVFSDPTARVYRREWTVRNSKGKPALTTVIVTIAGGGQRIEREETCDGFLPARFPGGLTWFQCVVEVTVELTGGTGTPAELPFPPRLGTPWELDETPDGGSRETAPYQATPHQDPTKARWERTATLVYYSSERPRKNPGDELAQRKDDTNDSYLLASGSTRVRS